MNGLQLLTGPLAQALGWALLHLLWQATIVAGILAAVLALMSRQTANARYVVSCSALALVFGLFVATTVRSYDPAAAPIAPAGTTSETIRISVADLPVLIAQSAAVGLKDRAISALTSARASLPAIVAIWLAGVVLLSTRLLLSWIQARRLVHHGTEPAAAEWQDTASRLAGALGLRRAVTLLQSSAVQVPSVIGSLRPAILLPASALTGLTPEQIEMVLAHELAHIRRHDFLVNLLQAVVETLMFYHPAVWWMSRRVRIERENCCDDMAVAVCGNPLQYARALTRLEELRASALKVVVAANGGSLLDRIRRIAAGRTEGTAATSRWVAALAVLAVLMIVVAIPSLPALAQREEKSRKTADLATASARPASSEVEVVEAAAAEESEDPEMLDTDLDIDVDIDTDVDTDFDYDFDSEAPEMPEPPLLPGRPVPAIAPAPRVHPVPGVRPVIAGVPAPPAPPAPLMAAFEHDFAFEFEHGDDRGAGDREIGASGKLTVEELIALRAHDVTPEYVNTMRSLFPGLTLRGVTGMKAVGVTPEFIRQMRSTGFEVKSAREASSLAAVGVTPEFVQQMRAAGLEVKSAKEASSLKAVGVTPELIAQMRAVGLAVKSAKEASTLAAVGVTPEFVRQMRDAGFAIEDAKDAAGLRAVGVEAEWLRAMKAAGVDIRTAKDARSLRAVGVTPEFVKKLAAAGYTNLSARELARLAAAGVDDDFIREMEQYRKKN
jgi:beta-lactamase regulating signal transducer with metallopeptidase domain